MTQDYTAYTPEDHEVWSILYNRQMIALPRLATQAYMDGIKKCGFEPDFVPKFRNVNKALSAATGWGIYVVPGLIDNKAFFQHLSRKEFPATTWLRSRAQLDYLEEPDMFHDVFGHIPLLSEPFFCDYLQGLSEILLDKIEDPVAVERIARLYWYTVEFGLIREHAELKIYGAGILSSSGESLYSVSQDATHVDFDPMLIMETPYIKEGYQQQYFIIDSYEELFRCLPQVKFFVDRPIIHAA